MADVRLGAVESRFADIIWEKEPVSSGRLVTLAEEALGWKKSTTYTILKRLCERGMFVNEGGVVRSLLSKEEFFARQSRAFVEDTFDGSLPAFLTAFGSGKKLSEQEASRLKAIIDSMRG